MINIGDSAFAGSDIQEVVVPKNVKCIGSGAFASCEKLQKVTMHVSKDISKQPALDYNVFTGCTSLDTIVLQYYDEEDSLMLMAASPDELRG